MDESQWTQIRWMLGVSFFLTFLAILLPFLPPHTAPLVLVGSLLVGAFLIIGIPAIRRLLPDRDEFAPEQTREEELKQQYSDDEISLEEFEDELDDLELLE